MSIKQATSKENEMNATDTAADTTFQVCEVYGVTKVSLDIPRILPIGSGGRDVQVWSFEYNPDYCTPDRPLFFAIGRYVRKDGTPGKSRANVMVTASDLPASVRAAYRARGI